MTYPLCFSCRCPMDPLTRERKSDIAQDGRAGERLCMVCERRIAAEEEAEAKERAQWPNG